MPLETGLSLLVAFVVATVVGTLALFSLGWWWTRRRLSTDWRHALTKMFETQRRLQDWKERHPDP